MKKQGLLDIIANLDSVGDTPSGKTTVLYSGKINGESMADFVVLKSDKNVRHIGKTDVGRFVIELSIEDYGNQQILQDIFFLVPKLQLWDAYKRTSNKIKPIKKRA
ncbi:MAG: Unknown protein [uncultured Sulfurovum sp.]|uniref:Uncharacterized protein n=1 Tax=uncultured Sulfurovum sp. TaxID=269237 RepID=A0A6S6TEH3_9BACT|nr:MAG: Unknown protein [uncultured Sulfurovum sp.]